MWLMLHQKNRTKQKKKNNSSSRRKIEPKKNTKNFCTTFETCNKSKKLK